MFTRRYYIFSLCLAFSVLMETVALTYMQQNGEYYYYSSSIIYLLCGLSICIFPILPCNGSNWQIKGTGTFNNIAPYLTGLLLLVLFAYHLTSLIKIYHNIDKKWADMLPTIQLACERFLAGRTVYGPATEIWPDAIIPYLPTMWLPFLPAVAFHFDLRWVTFTIQFLGILLAFLPLFIRAKTVLLIPFIIGVVSIFLLSNYFLVKRVDYWAMTEEGVVAGFYLILSFALLQRNYWFIGIAMMLCSLSRYSLIFWIPVFFIYILLNNSLVDFIKLFISYTISMLIFFVVPFFINDPNYFIKIPSTYTRFIDGFWVQYGIDQHMLHNVGLFKFFTTKNVHVMSFLEVITSLAAPALLLYILTRLKKKYNFNKKYIPYASLKISLIFFYGFIQMPYLYVFLPATIISYTVLFDYLVVRNTEFGREFN